MKLWQQNFNSKKSIISQDTIFIIDWKNIETSNITKTDTSNKRKNKAKSMGKSKYKNKEIKGYLEQVQTWGDPYRNTTEELIYTSVILKFNIKHNIEEYGEKMYLKFSNQIIKKRLQKELNIK